MTKYSKGDRFTLEGGLIRGVVDYVYDGGRSGIKFDGESFTSLVPTTWLEAHSTPVRKTFIEQFDALPVYSRFKTDRVGDVRIKLNNAYYATISSTDGHPEVYSKFVLGSTTQIEVVE